MEGETRTTVEEEPKLANPIRILYFLNGATLALPSTALMAILNDVVQIPLNLLAAYGVIAFMPFSFKPLYSYLSTWLCQQGYLSMSMLMAILLIMSGITTFLSGFVPKDGVIICFLIAFVRGIAVAFPEFLLGTFLVKQARKHSADPIVSNEYHQANRENHTSTEEEYQNNLEFSSFKKLASIYQSQASMSRNVGSFLASLVSFIIYFSNKSDSLSIKNLRLMLLVAGLLPVGGAMVVLYNDYITHETVSQHLKKRKRSELTYDEILLNDISQHRSDATTLENSLASEPQLDDNVESEMCAAKVDDVSTVGYNTYDKKLMIILQTLLIWVVLQSTFVGNSSFDFIWKIGFGIIVFIAILIMREIADNSAKSLFQHKIVLYLILKQAIPDLSFIWSSYIYFLFGTRPAFLQLLSVLSSVGMVLGSGLYNRYLSVWRVKNSIMITTLFSSIATLLHLVLTNAWKDVDYLSNFHVGAAIALALLSSACSEAEFIPSVIIATSNILSSDERDANSGMNGESCEIKECDDKDVFDSMQYSAYISFIDFGSQIGAWVSIPIIEMLHLSRDNWSALFYFVIICTVMNILSLALIACI